MTDDEAIATLRQIADDLRPAGAVTNDIGGRRRTINIDDLYAHPQAAEVEARLDGLFAAGRIRSWGGGYVSYLDIFEDVVQLTV